MSATKKKTIKFTALMTVFILTVAYFSLLTPTSAYFYKEFNEQDATIKFSLLDFNVTDNTVENGIFEGEYELKFKGATKFADYGEKLFDEVAITKEFTVTNTGVDAKILPRVTLHDDSAANGLKYMVIFEDSEAEAVSEETSDNVEVEKETVTKGKLKEEIESRLELFPETTTQEGETSTEPTIGYSAAVSKLDAFNEIKSVELKSGESVNVKIIFWAEYTDIVNVKGESTWQDAGSIENISYQCTIEMIASQLSEEDAAVTTALAEVPTWKTTTAENQ